MTLPFFSLITFNLLIISLLSFFTAWLLVESILFIFRIRSNRFRSFARMIPFCKIPIDLCCMNWANWALLHDTYPWLCEKNSRTLEAFCKLPSDFLHTIFPKIGIYLHTQEFYTFSVADYLAHWIDFSHIFFLSILGIGYACLFTLYRLIGLVQDWVYVKQIQASSVPLLYKITNPLLKDCLSKRKPLIFKNASYQGSPFATGLWRQKIVFSSTFLKQLSPLEFEAVLSHELGHTRFRDPLVRFILRLLRALFTWIPMRSLEKLISFDQELACDQYLSKFKIDKLHLASAICKLAKLHSAQKMKSYQIPFFEKCNVKRRVYILLLKSKTAPHPFLVFTFVILASYFLLGVLLGRFWLL